MDVESLPQLVRNTKRFNEIVATISKFGLAPWMRNISSEWVQNLFRDREGELISQMSQPVRVRNAMTELGTTFIKLGQILSTRPDLVGPEWTEELSKLQSQTPADSPEVVRQTIVSEFGVQPELLFAEFDDVAFASASIGQVHKARLHDGMEVVVKVQHQGIEGRIRSDLEILKQLAKLAQSYSPVMAQYRPVATMEEFARTLLAELDYTKERSNLERFTKNFSSSKDVCIPKAYPEQSSHRVLTMDRLRGISIKDHEAINQAGLDSSDIAQRGATMFLDMIFRDGFYHADPHPGNLLVVSDGKIGLLDFGMVGRIDQGLREQFENLLIAAVSQDSRRLSDLVIRMGTPPRELDEDELRSDIDEFVAEFAGQALDEFDLSGALNRMTAIVRTHSIVLPSRVSLLLKVLIMLEGSSRLLSPNFSLAQLLQPYQSQIVKRRWSPKRLKRRLQQSYQDWNGLIENLPGELSEILRQIKRGKFDVHLEHRRMESTVNRLVMGLLASALFIGSAQLWSLKVPPIIGGFSIPGALGCAVAVTLSFRLLHAIKKSGDIFEKHSP